MLWINSRVRNLCLSHPLTRIALWFAGYLCKDRLTFLNIGADEWMKERLKLKLDMEWRKQSILFFSLPFFSFFSKFQFSSSRILFCILLPFSLIPYYDFLFYILVSVWIFFSSSVIKTIKESVYFEKRQ